MKSYAFGFACSLLLTLGAFLLAPQFGGLAFPAIIASALLQLFVQLVCFLHLGNPRQRGQLLMLGFTAVILFILVGGTLWIMSNLAHLHAHAPAATDLYEHGVVAPQNELR